MSEDKLCKFKSLEVNLSAIDIVRNLSLEDVKYKRKEFEFYKMKDVDPAISRKQLLLFLSLHS